MQGSRPGRSKSTGAKRALGPPARIGRSGGRRAQDEAAAASPETGERKAPIEVGVLLRAVREERGLSLTAASVLCGVGRSTIAKIEAGRMSPTIGLVEKIAAALELDPSSLLAPRVEPPATGRRAVTRAGRGRSMVSGEMVYEALGSELSNKLMMAFRSRIPARASLDVPAWHRHDGEELIYVLEGAVTMYSELYEPEQLHAGDSVYLDARMGHCVVAANDREATVLFVITGWR